MALYLCAESAAHWRGRDYKVGTRIKNDNGIKELVKELKNSGKK